MKDDPRNCLAVLKEAASSKAGECAHPGMCPQKWKTIQEEKETKGTGKKGSRQE